MNDHQIRDEVGVLCGTMAKLGDFPPPSSCYHLSYSHAVSALEGRLPVSPTNCRNYVATGQRAVRGEAAVGASFDQVR
jgi:hypothetical protein